MIPQNWWQQNQFMMPARPAGMLLPQYQPVSPGLLASGAEPPPKQPSGLLNYNLDGNPSTDTGTADPSVGPSVDVGIGPSSGAPGTGGIGGMMGGVVAGLGAVTSPVGFALGSLANQVMGRKSTAQQVMEAINGGGVSPGDDGTPGGDDTNAAPGSGTVSGNTGIAVGPDADAQQNNPQGTPGTVGVNETGNQGVVGTVGNDPTNPNDNPGVSVGPGGDGAGGGAGGDGTVICTLLHELGYLPDAVYAADAEYGRNADAALIAGYHSWAVPYVCLCRRDNPVARAALGLAKLIAIPWANEMAYRAGVLPQGSRLGAFLFALGVPVCRGLGKLIIALHAARIRPA